MTIKLLITGGTLDKHYNELNGELVFNQSLIPDMLKQGRCTLDIITETILSKDSLDMDDHDRKVIYESCKSTKQTQIIITHGTDTMVETARVLSEGLKGKIIILVGAMIPYAFKQSDALFNLGCAVTSVQCLQEGVYIVMNGQIFSWDNVVKNKVKGLFQTK